MSDPQRAFVSRLLGVVKAGRSRLRCRKRARPDYRTGQLGVAEACLHTTYEARRVVE